MCKFVVINFKTFNMEQSTYNMIRKLTAQNDDMSDDLLTTIQMVNKPMFKEKPNDAYTLIQEYYEIRELFEDYLEDSARNVEPGDWGQFEIQHGYFSATADIYRYENTFEIINIKYLLHEKSEDLINN